MIDYQKTYPLTSKENLPILLPTPDEITVAIFDEIGINTRDDLQFLLRNAA